MISSVLGLQRSATTRTSPIMYRLRLKKIKLISLDFQTFPAIKTDSLFVHHENHPPTWLFSSEAQKEQHSRHSMKNCPLGGKVWDKFQEKLQDHVQASGEYHDHDQAMIATVVDGVWEISWMKLGTWSEWWGNGYHGSNFEYKKGIFWWKCVALTALCADVYWGDPDMQRTTWEVL